MSAPASTVPAVSAEIPPHAPVSAGKSTRKAAAPKAGKAASGSMEKIPWRDLSVPLGVLGIVLFMITPIPAFLLDLLISANITLCLTVFHGRS